MTNNTTIAELRRKATTDPSTLTVSEVAQLSRLKRLQAQPTSSTSRFIVHSRREVAEFFGRSVDRVDAWIKSGMPKLGTSKYDLSEIAKWRLSRKADNALNQSAATDDEKRERLALVRERRLTVIQTRRIQSGRLIDKADVTADQARRIHAVKSGLLTLSRVLTSEIAASPAQAQAIIEARINDLLTAYSEGWEGVGNIPEVKSKT